MGTCEKHRVSVLRNALPIPVAPLPRVKSVRKLVTTHSMRDQADQGDGIFLDSSPPHVHKHLKNVNPNKNALISFQPI